MSFASQRADGRSELSAEPVREPDMDQGQVAFQTLQTEQARLSEGQSSGLNARPGAAMRRTNPPRWHRYGLNALEIRAVKDWIEESPLAHLAQVELLERNLTPNQRAQSHATMVEHVPYVRSFVAPEDIRRFGRDLSGHLPPDAEPRATGGFTTILSSAMTKIPSYHGIVHRFIKKDCTEDVLRQLKQAVWEGRPYLTPHVTATTKDQNFLPQLPAHNDDDGVYSADLRLHLLSTTNADLTTVYDLTQVMDIFQREQEVLLPCGVPLVIESSFQRNDDSPYHVCLYQNGIDPDQARNAFAALKHDICRSEGQAALQAGADEHARFGLTELEEHAVFDWFMETDMSSLMQRACLSWHWEGQVPIEVCAKNERERQYYASNVLSADLDYYGSKGHDPLYRPPSGLGNEPLRGAVIGYGHALYDAMTKIDSYHAVTHRVVRNEYLAGTCRQITQALQGDRWYRTPFFTSTSKSEHILAAMNHDQNNDCDVSYSGRLQMHFLSTSNADLTQMRTLLLGADWATTADPHHFSLREQEVLIPPDVDFRIERCYEHSSPQQMHVFLYQDGLPPDRVAACFDHVENQLRAQDRVARPFGGLGAAFGNVMHD